jgi:hypothetical protein
MSAIELEPSSGQGLQSCKLRVRHMWTVKYIRKKLLE